LQSFFLPPHWKSLIRVVFLYHPLFFVFSLLIVRTFVWITIVLFESPINN
jgi:hypothetical protein